jgi:hypothetical protein
MELTQEMIDLYHRATQEPARDPEAVCVSKVSVSNPYHDTNKELPDDVLGIIRDFSKPLLRYPREYREAMLVLKREWPELKEKLCGPHADEYLMYLQAYAAAYTATNEAAQELSNAEQEVTAYMRKPHTSLILPSTDEVVEQMFARRRLLNYEVGKKAKLERRILSELNAILQDF